MVLQYHVRNGFSGTGQLIGDIQQLSEVGIDRLSGNWTQLTKFSEECQLAYGSACCVHSVCKHLPHSHRILDLVEIGLSRGAARSIDDSTSLCPTGGEVFIGPALHDGSIGKTIGILRVLLFFNHNLPGLDAVQNLFAVFFPGGIIRGVEEGDGSQGVLEGLFVCSI